MTILKAIIDQFLPEWAGGQRLISGASLGTLAAQLYSVQDNIVAHPGGGRAGATPLAAAFCDITVVASTNDSVLLPYAIPGNSFNVSNSSANGAQIWAQPSNPHNGGTADVIMNQGSNTPLSNVGFNPGYVGNFYCTKPGVWRKDI